MTITEINKILSRLAENPTRENILDFSMHCWNIVLGIITQIAIGAGMNMKMAASIFT